MPTLTPVFAEIKASFEAEGEIGGVHFRPTDKGVTVVDLSATAPKPRVGVGANPYLRIGATAAAVRPTMAARVAHLRSIRARQVSESEENQLEARLIREAQANALQLPGFPKQVRLINECGSFGAC